MTYRVSLVLYPKTSSQMESIEFGHIAIPGNACNPQDAPNLFLLACFLGRLRRLACLLGLCKGWWMRVVSDDCSQVNTIAKRTHCQQT